MANELKTTKLVLIGGEPIRLPIRAADPVSGLEEGQLYYNSTSSSVRIYDGSIWADVSGVSAAEDVTYDNVASGLTATDVQAAIDEVDADLDAVEEDVADLVTLSGVAANSEDLGTFTGITIPDASDIKEALQSLETALEAIPAAPVEFADDEFRIVDDVDATKKAAFEVSAITTATTRTITVPDANVDLGDIASQAQDIADLVSLSGVAANEVDLGTFTGDIIPDESTIKEALQSLETAVESLPDPITYEGTWSAATNTPTLANGIGNNGDLYQVIAAGSVDFGAGAISFEIGDKVVYNGTVYEKWDMTDAVTSVNSQTGTVVLDSDDIAEGSSNLYFSEQKVLDTVLTGGTFPEGIILATDNVLEAFEKVDSSFGDKANIDLGNLSSTAVNISIIPATDADIDLGSSTKQFVNVHTAGISNSDAVAPLEITSVSSMIKLQGEGGVSRADDAGTIDDAVVEQYFHARSLAANVSTFTTISGLSFPNASFDGMELDFRIKEASTGLVRIGKMYVAADGTNVSYSPQYTETGILGDDADGEGLKLQAILSSGNILIQFKDTKAVNACTMNVDVKLFKA